MPTRDPSTAGEGEFSLAEAAELARDNFAMNPDLGFISSGGWRFERAELEGMVQAPDAPAPRADNEAPPIRGGPQVTVPPIIREIANDVALDVAERVRRVTEDLNRMKSDLERQIRERLAKADPAIQKALDVLKKQLDLATMVLGPNVIALIGSALGGIQSLVAAFLANAADVDDVAEAGAAKVRENAPGLLGFALDAISGGFGGAVLGVLDKIESEHAAQLAAALRRVQEAAQGDQDVAAMLDVRPGETTPFALILGAAIAIGLAGSVAQSVFAPYLEGTQQSAWRKDPIRLAGPSEAASAVVRGLRAPEAMARIAAASGYGQDQLDLLVDLAKSWPTPGDTIAAGYRGALDPDGVAAYLRLAGYDENAQRVLEAAAIVLPGPQDLVRFAVREVYSPNTLGRAEMLAEFPETFAAEAARIGMPRDVAVAFWLAHYELPSIGQGFEMLQRHVITAAEMNALLALADVHPWWRDKLTRISYLPITRVDIRRFHKLGLLDRAGLVRRYEDVGYSLEDAEQLATFTEKLNSQEKKDDGAALRGRIVTRVQNALSGGTLSEAQSRTALAALGESPTEVDVAVKESLLARAEQLAAAVADRVGDLYVGDHWTWDEAAAALTSRGFTPGELAARRELWDLERELHSPKARTLADRDLSAAETIAAMLEGIVTEAQARTALLAMRYDAAEVDVKVRLAKVKLADQVQKDEIEITHQRMRSGKIGDLEAQLELDRVGVRTTQRDALIAKWTAEKRAVNANLPVGTLGELLKRELISPSDARSRLGALGYDAAESDMWLALWGDQAATTAAKAATAAQRKAEAEQRASALKERDLSTAQLIAAYKALVLNEAALRVSLGALGYSAAEVSTLVATAKAKAPAAPKGKV